VGLIGAGMAGAALALGLSPPVAAGLALGVQALATGALHEDGLADCADGFWGGRTPERRLAIMADSRLGSYGALALVLVTGLRWAAFADVLAGGALLAPVALVAVGALSRWPMAALLWALPPAREGGLARLVGRPSGGVVTAGGLVALTVAAVTVGWASLPLLALTAIAAFLWSLVARAKVGGQTGDACGALQQLCDAACLVALSVRSA
jgi:adenosylcobinamide-GDP ribazoletransferase